MTDYQPLRTIPPVCETIAPGYNLTCPGESERVYTGIHRHIGAYFDLAHIYPGGRTIFQEVVKVLFFFGGAQSRLIGQCRQQNNQSNK